MLEQTQLYPNYKDWVDGKCLPRVESGQATAWIAIADSEVVGDVVYQQLDAARIEIKNLRVDPEYRNRAIGYCLLHQVEVGGQQGLADTSPHGLIIVADVSTANFSGVEFFVRNGFSITGMEDLYAKGQAEYLIEKISTSMNGRCLATATELTLEQLHQLRDLS